MAARFPRGKLPEFPVFCTGTRKLSCIIFTARGLVVDDYYTTLLAQCRFCLGIVGRGGAMDGGWGWGGGGGGGVQQGCDVTLDVQLL